jgi:hypothetical protein
MALQRLTEDDTIQRLGRGLYYYPKKHPVLGIMSPAPADIAKAIAGRAKARLLPSGAYAANLLGLSEQVPAKITFLTDAPSKKVRVGKQVVELKQASSRTMATANKISGLVTQAFRYLGRKNIRPEMIAALSHRLNGRQKKILLQDSSSAPAWIADYFRKIAETPFNG